MKTSRIMLAAALSMALLGAGALQAKVKKFGGQGMGNAQGKMHKWLELSADQEAKMKEAGKAHRDAMKPLWEKVKTDIETLKSQVEKKAADAELTATLATLRTDRAAIEAENTRHQDALKAFLTPLQQAKAALGMAKQMKEGMGGGRGKWGGHDKGDKDGDDKDEKEGHDEGHEKY